ncbi:MAG: thiamine-binding protein [Flavisolibacter sp.]|nr:thiamine-binding protein [Flavisolibacter sp.]MBD0366768.1 thiamine-binding protein [Flavisolibacter sp.]MBD0374976.1 thiamine-binding protein [Flavisolibacter sp.]
MHSFIVNASIQIVPIVQDKHPYDWIDEAIGVIKRSNIKYEVGPFATILEGTYDEVWKVIHSINEYLSERKCAEWIQNIQLQIRSEKDSTADEKVNKHH